MPPAELLDAARALEACDVDPEPELLRHLLRLTLARSRDERGRFDEVFDAFLAAWRPPRLRHRPLAQPGGVGEGEPRSAARGGMPRDRPPARLSERASQPSTQRPAGRPSLEEASRHPRGGPVPEGADEPGTSPQGIDAEELLRLLESGDAYDASPPSPKVVRAPASGAAAPPAFAAPPFRAAGSSGCIPPFSALSPGEVPALLEMVRQVAAQVWLRRSRRSRRWKSGRVDIKSTMALAMRGGGLPFRLVRRKRRLRRAHLVLLLDVSGSVRHAARFMLVLAQALKTAFSSSRAFLFVDRPVEVTTTLDQEILATSDGWESAFPQVDWMGKSDFGHTFFRLLEEHESALRKDTLLVILGDARNNRANPMPWTLGQIRDRVGRIIWLNPEPRGRWNTGDSCLSAYTPWCDGVEPCEHVADLRRVAERWVHLAARWKPGR